MYLANDDPASGIHNPLYVLTLINESMNWVRLELSQ